MLSTSAVAICTADSVLSYPHPYPSSQDDIKLLAIKTGQTNREIFVTCCKNSFNN